MSGVKIADTDTTTRSVQPHTARPTAVAAGLCRSTVSVNAAIHGANVKPLNTPMPTSSHAKW